MLFRKLCRGALVLACSIGLLCAAVDDDDDDDDDQKKNSVVSLNRLVVVGDSLTAGFQNFSLFSTTPVLPPGGQANGYPALIAKQAGVNMTLPLVSYPGLPPALKLTPSGIIREAGLGFRTNPAVQVTNLSVPGFLLADALSRPFPGNPQVNPIDALSATVLGSPAGVLPGCGPFPVAGALAVSQVACAVALRPTAILVSIGNNDALQSLTFGTPPTDAAAFGWNLLRLFTTLSATKAPIMIANIPDVSAIPFLLPVPAFRAQCPNSPLVASNADFVVPDITNPALTSVNVCVSYQVRPAALIARSRAAVLAYNRIIQALAGEFDAVVVDVNGLFSQIASKGYNVRGLKLTTGFLGGIFSLDGIHPTNTGHAILANEFIGAIKKKWKLNVPEVPIHEVADTDPLVFRVR